MKKTIPLAGQYGVIRDQPPQELPDNAWTFVQNARFRDGWAGRTYGERAFLTAPPVEQHYLQYFQSSTVRYVLTAGNTAVYSDDGATQTNITRLTAGKQIVSITFSGTTATLTTTTSHGLANGTKVEVFDAAPSQYNGSFTITSTGANTFTYTMASAPASNATLVGNYSTAGIQAFTGARDDRWSGGNLNGIWVANNGIDMPHYWGGDIALPMRPLPGWPHTMRAKVVRPFKNYLIALDITKGSNRYSNRVKWSASADPGTMPTSWDETDPTKDGGEVDLAEEPSGLIDFVPMGGVGIIYKEAAMHAMELGGAQYIWNFRRLPGDVGAINRGCIANIHVGHVVLTYGDVIFHSGQGPKSIINARLRDWLFLNIDSANIRRSYLVPHYVRNEVWVCVPTTGNAYCNLALIWNWVDDTWMIRDLNGANYADSGRIDWDTSKSWDSQVPTWDAASGAWDGDIYGSNVSKLAQTGSGPLIKQVDYGATFNGAMYTTILERKGMAFETPEQVKLLKCIYPRIDAISGTQVRIEFGASMDAEVDPTWSSPVVYTVGSTFKADSFALGRFLAVRFTSLDNNWWRLKSYDVDIEPRGKY